MAGPDWIGHRFVGLVAVRYALHIGQRCRYVAKIEQLVSLARIFIRAWSFAKTGQPPSRATVVSCRHLSPRGDRVGVHPMRERDGEDGDVVARLSRVRAREVSDALKRAKVERLHLNAHSMGSRSLVRALADLMVELAPEGPLLNHVILSAPDIDADVFKDIAKRITTSARQFTL